MPYVIEEIEAGQTMEVGMYYTSRYGKKGQKKSDRVKPTSESQKKVNQRKAEQRLRLLLTANFRDGVDGHIDFGYIRKKGSPHRTKEEMKKDIRKLLDLLRTEYKKKGKVLKYIHVMEVGAKGSRHHHMVLNDIDSEMLTRCWNKVCSGSRIHISPLDTQGDYSKLASYLIKYTSETLGTEEALMGKRWNSSKNLVQPIIKRRIIRHRNQFMENPKPKKGYYIIPDSVERGIHSPEYGGYGFIRYRMMKLRC